MMSNPVLLLSILLNTALAFFTAAACVETLIVACRIHRHRLRACLRLIPYACAIIDRIFSEFSLVNWLNPLSCDSCIQKFVLQVFFPQLKVLLQAGNTSLVNHLAVGYLEHTANTLFTLFCLITSLSVLRTFCQLLLQARELRATIKNGTSSTRSVDNLALAAAIRHCRAEIIIGDAALPPLVTYAGVVLMPKQVVEAVSQQEFNAILAHEIDHLRWHDPLARLFCQLTASLFWWIPTQWWLRKVMQDQEMACDRAILDYGLDSESLASSLIKVTKLAKGMNRAAVCAFFSKGNPLKERINAILGNTPTYRYPLGPGIISIGLASLLLTCVLFR